MKALCYSERSQRISLCAVFKNTSHWTKLTTWPATETEPKLTQVYSDQMRWCFVLVAIFCKCIFIFWVSIKHRQTFHCAPRSLYTQDKLRTSTKANVHACLCIDRYSNLIFAALASRWWQRLHNNIRWLHSTPDMKRTETVQPIGHITAISLAFDSLGLDSNHKIPYVFLSRLKANWNHWRKNSPASLQTLVSLYLRCMGLEGNQFVWLMRTMRGLHFVSHSLT